MAEYHKKIRLTTLVKAFIIFSIVLLVSDACLILMAKWLETALNEFGLSKANSINGMDQVQSFFMALNAKANEITTNVTFVTIIFLFISLVLSAVFLLKSESGGSPQGVEGRGDFDDIDVEGLTHDPRDHPGEALLKAGLLKAEAIKSDLLSQQELLIQPEPDKAPLSLGQEPAASIEDRFMAPVSAEASIFPDEMDDEMESADSLDANSGAEENGEEAAEKGFSSEEDESATLAHSYTKMVEALKKVHELERHHSIELSDANKKLQKEIVERKKAEAEIRHLSNRLISGIEEARKELAQDLHDEFGQTLTALHLGLEGLWNSIPEALVEQKKRIDGLVLLIEQLGDKIRSISSELRPDLLDDLGLVPTIEWYINEFSESHPGIHSTFQAVGFRKRLPPAIELVLYRVFQESMNNVVKHAKAERVSITLTYSHPKILMTVKDNGVGFDTHKAFDGIGLLGMRERVGSVNGMIEIHSGKNKGVTIRIELPVA